MKVVEVRVLFRAPRFAQMGYAWRRHVEAIWVERVRRSSQSADGLADQCPESLSVMGKLEAPDCTRQSYAVRTTTWVPISTASNRSATSSFSMRMQPEETDFPMVAGSFVP